MATTDNSWQIALGRSKTTPTLPGDMYPPPTLRRLSGWKRSTEMKFLTSSLWDIQSYGSNLCWGGQFERLIGLMTATKTKIGVVDRTNRSASRCRNYPQQLATDVYGRGCVITLFKSQYIAVHQYQHLTRNDTLSLGGKEHQERAKNNKSNLQKLSDRISACPARTTWLKSCGTGRTITEGEQ